MLLLQRRHNSSMELAFPAMALTRFFISLFEPILQLLAAVGLF
jgi:hypothetical protein